MIKSIRPKKRVGKNEIGIDKIGIDKFDLEWIKLN